MKKNVILLILIVSVFSACKEINNSSTPINESSVSGVWKAKEFESTIPDIPEEYLEAGKKEFLSSVYTLNEDNTLEVRSDYFREGARGHWELDVEKKELSMFYEMDTIKGVETYNILELSSKAMTLRQEMTEVNAYVQITLEKQQ